MNELKELIEKAKNQLGGYIELEIACDGNWNLSKMGDPEEDIYDGTFDQCIAKLKEWATPPKPEFVMVKVQYEVAKMYAKNGFIQGIAASCQEAIKPYEV